MTDGGSERYGGKGGWYLARSCMLGDGGGVCGSGWSWSGRCRERRLVPLPVIHVWASLDCALLTDTLVRQQRMTETAAPKARSASHTRKCCTMYTPQSHTQEWRDRMTNSWRRAQKPPLPTILLGNHPPSIR